MCYEQFYNTANISKIMGEYNWDGGPPRQGIVFRGEYNLKLMGGGQIVRRWPGVQWAAVVAAAIGGVIAAEGGDCKGEGGLACRDERIGGRNNRWHSYN